MFDMAKIDNLNEKLSILIDEQDSELRQSVSTFCVDLADDKYGGILAHREVMRWGSMGIITREQQERITEKLDILFPDLKNPE